MPRNSWASLILYKGWSCKLSSPNFAPGESCQCLRIENLIILVPGELLEWAQQHVHSSMSAVLSPASKLPKDINKTPTTESHQVPGKDSVDLELNKLYWTQSKSQVTTETFCFPVRSIIFIASRFFTIIDLPCHLAPVWYWVYYGQNTHTQKKNKSSLLHLLLDVEVKIRNSDVCDVDITITLLFISIPYQ